MEAKVKKKKKIWANAKKKKFEQKKIWENLSKLKGQEADAFLAGDLFG